MRNKFIAGNWKMNNTRHETSALIGQLLQSTTAIDKTTIMVAPPFTCLHLASELLAGTRIQLGAQNMHWETKGAFTGEVSGIMLQDVKCNYVILGHSERRQYFGETDEGVNKKIKAALTHGLAPVICVGETLEQREKGNAKSVVERQIRDSLAGFESAQARQFTIAYEPVWAIGTGKAATPADAVEIHSLIRKLLTNLFGSDVADVIRIQYGGSVTADNIDSFITENEIDGALVGGASLKADAFVKIIEAAERSQE